MRLTSLIGLLLALSPSILAKNKKNDAVLLSKVKTLTLRDGELTSHRRVKPLPQLNCVGGSAKGLYDVDVMRCTNSGAEYDNEDIQWTCKAELPPEFKLGRTDVICEGYDNPDDPYILKGSCGVEYRLVLTDLGEEKHKDRLGKRPRRSRKSDSDSENDSLAGYIFWAFFACVVLVLLYSVFFSSRNNPPGRRFGEGYGRGGGGGGDDNDDPPPPYTPRAPPKSKSYGSTRSSSSRSSSSRQQNQPWQPGFWTGTAAGAAAGYAAGNYAGRQNRNDARAGTSNWFGGTNTSPTYDRPPPRNNYGGSWGGGSSSAGPSNSHESTGFGGTRRR